MHLSKMTAAILDDLDYAVDASAVRFKCSREDTIVYIHIYVYIYIYLQHLTSPKK